MNIEQGLEFILDHFEEPIFPRTILTKLHNKPILVHTKEEALQLFKQAGLVDCMISAFSKNEIDEVIPNIILIDLDNFKALDETLFAFGSDLRAKPLVLSYGDEFTVIQPIKMNSWKNNTRYGKNDKDLVTLFLQFTSLYLSNNKCISNNYGLESCLIRVPSSVNSKNNKKVEIQTFWDGRRIDVTNLRFVDFIDQLEQEKSNQQSLTDDVSYVEFLLKQKINDDRIKICNLVILPYLINIKKLPVNLILKGVYDYFDGYIPKEVILREANHVEKNKIMPYGLSKMKKNDPILYNIITSKLAY